jgi:DNA-binding MarR family transcriptional regulator
MKSAFDPESQELNINSKIVVALERISEAFKVSLWNENKKFGISPIQLQILTFLLFHPEELRTISNLAAEFNSTKASISDSVKTLENKGYIIRQKSLKDFRISNISLTEKGSEIAIQVSKFANYMEEIIQEMPEIKKGIFLELLLQVIHHLFLKEIISIQRMCLTCCFYKKDQYENYYCTLMNMPINSPDIRIDCTKYE